MSPITTLYCYTLLSLLGQTAYAGGTGSWGPTINFPLVPVAAAVLPQTGEVLVWSAGQDTGFGTADNMTQTAIYNPADGSVTQYTITDTQHDMFCPGISMDFNGRVVVTGGQTSQRTSIFDDASATSWSSGGDMNIPRGYQSSTILSDGRIFTIGGSWSGGQGGKNGEVFDGSTNTWTLLPGCPVAPMITADEARVYRADNHAWLFSWVNGWVLQAGPSAAMNWYSTTADGSQVSAGPRGDDPDAMTGNAVLYDAVAGNILAVGGSPSYDSSYATANAHIITLADPGSNLAVQSINPMYSARAFANSVVLPDGTVFITGGVTYAVVFTDANATMIPELWDPVTTQFTQMAANPTPRTYHSVALLLPDATVFNGGGGLCGDGCPANHLDAQIFSPPYLFLADGVTPAPRPTILSVITPALTVGDSMTVNTDSDTPNFSLIRTSATTHTVNTDQRRIPLTPTVNPDGSYTLQLPSDSGIITPGYWMLFAINADGVPSVATTILVNL